MGDFKSYTFFVSIQVLILVCVEVSVGGVREFYNNPSIEKS